MEALQPITIMPTLPKALRPDDSYTCEDQSCDLHCEYVIHDYGSADAAPSVEVIAIYADFGGRNLVNVPLCSISGKKLLHLEALCADDVTEQEYLRGQDAKNFPEGER
jgi:hypothetical protein